MISLELNRIFHIIITCLNIVICIAIYILCHPAMKKYYHVSKSVKLYFMFSLYPYILLLNITSVFTGIYYIIYDTTDTQTYQIVRLMLAYSAIQIRFSYFFLVISRIIALVFYKSYSKYSGSTRQVIIAIILTQIPSLLNGYFEYVRVFTDINKYFFIIYIGVLTHIITLILCKVLHEINKQKYKSLAYQSSLAERHQIYKNVNILKSIWPIIFIFSTVAPLGPLAAISYRYFFGTGGPTAIYYMFYNLAFLIMLFWRLSLPKTPAIGKSVQLQNGHLRSQKQPEIIPIDQYFQDLKNQWK